MVTQHPDRSSNEYQSRSEKVDFFCRLELTAIPSGTTHPAQSINLSLQDAGIATKAVFQNGQLVLVTFFLKDQHQAQALQRVTGEVADFTSGRDSNTMRVEFLHPLAGEQQVLVDKLLSR